MNKLARIIIWLSIIGVLIIGAIRLSAKDKDKPKDTPAVTAKVLPPDLVIAYFKARAEKAEADARDLAATAAFNAAVQSLQSICEIALDLKGIPICQTPPPPTEPKKDTK